MCQLGAVLVSDSRVFRHDGRRWHQDLRRLAREKYPGEQFRSAEYDFAARCWAYGERSAEYDFAEHRWAYGDRSPAKAALLRDFALENWADAEALMRFCKHARMAPKGTLIGQAREQYDAKCQRFYNATYLTTAMSNRRYFRQRFPHPQLMCREDHEKLRALYVKQRESSAPLEAEEAFYLLWLRLFSDPESRIPAWQ